MSELQTTKITNRAGTGSPNFSQGLKISGTDSGLIAPTRTEGETQPDAETSSNGDTFYDTVNETYDILIEGAWVRVLGAGGGASWTISDISAASYDNISFDLSTSAYSSPQDIAFNADGTKMYVPGSTTDSVFEYTLSTAFDLSTASYNSVSFNPSTQDNNPSSVAFNTDGTKMYVAGYGSDGVYQYSLSTGFDLSTASYDNVSFSVASQDTFPRDISFNTDGTKMFMQGIASNSVHQYSLSTGFDLSTASYDSVSFSVLGSSGGLFFNPDGTKFYLVHYIAGSNAVHQYSLSTGFDLSTASYDSISFSVESQTDSSLGIAFSNDGTKMFIVCSSNKYIYQYSTGL